MGKDVVIILTPTIQSFTHELYFDRPTDLLNVNGQSLLERIIISIKNKQIYIVINKEQTYYCKLFGYIPGIIFLNTNKYKCEKIEQLAFALENIKLEGETITILESDAIFSSKILNKFFQDTSMKKYIKNEFFIGAISFPLAVVSQINKHIYNHRYKFYQEFATDIVTCEYKLFECDRKDFLLITNKSDYLYALNSGFNKIKETYTKDSTTLLLPPMKKFVGVYDVIGAQLSQLLGFDGLWLGSYQLSLALGVKDDETYNPNIAIKLCEDIKKASVTLPIIIDIGSGFSNEHELLEFAQYCNSNTSIIALCIDDNDSVRNNSMYTNCQRKLLSTSKFIQRINKLKKYFRKDMLFIARTEIIIVEQEDINLNTLNKKSKQLLNGCANIFLPHYINNNVFFFEKIFKSFNDDCPLLSIPTGLINMKPSFFEEMGINIVIYANVDMRNRINSLINLYSRISSNLDTPELDFLPTADSIKYLIDCL